MVILTLTELGFFFCALKWTILIVIKTTIIPITIIISTDTVIAIGIMSPVWFVLPLTRSEVIDWFKLVWEGGKT